MPFYHPDYKEAAVIRVTRTIEVIGVALLIVAMLSIGIWLSGHL